MGTATRDMRNFNTFLRNINLLEILISNGRFTWSKEGEVPLKSLIDRFLVSSNWEEAFENLRVARQVCVISDHFPILLEVGAFESEPSPFWFFSSGMKDKDCCRQIERVFAEDKQLGWAGFVTFSKFRKIKTALKKCG